MRIVITGSTKLIDGEYYQGAYGPTIVLNAVSLAAVEWVHGIFMRLAAKGKEGAIDLAALPEVVIQGVKSFTLMQVAEQPDVMLRSHTTSDNLEFQWRQNAGNWRRTAALLEPFLAGRPGHQYLTQENRDAALVEFSFGEFENR